MEEIIFPEELETIGESSFAYSGLKSVVIPNSVTLIDSSAFSNSWYLEKARIPNSVTKIRNGAFLNCGISSDKDFQIYCSENSEAEKYAKENAIQCKPFNMWNHVHSYESSITKEATCTKKGIKTYTCSCGDEYIEEIPATGHEIIKDIAIEPTETDPGKTEGSHCGICGEVFEVQEVIPATGKAEEKPTESPYEQEINIKNTFNGCKENPVKLSITCKESDEFTFKCQDKCWMENNFIGYSSIVVGGFSSCSKEYSLTFHNSGTHTVEVYKNGSLIEYDKIIIAEDHSWDSGNIESKPTCIKTGKKKFTCSNCGNSYTEEISATGHKYEEKITRKETCTSNGIKKITCSNCGDSYTEEIYATGHKYEEKITRKETCTSNGMKKITCSNCGDSYTEEIYATGHKYEEQVLNKETCSSDGLIKNTCSKCWHSFTTSVPATGKHIWTEWNVCEKKECTEQGSEERECSVCHNKEKRITSDSGEHVWSKWEVSKKPTALKTGEHKRVCNVCNVSEKETLNKLKAKITLSFKKKTLSVRKSFVLKIKKQTYGDKILKFISNNKKVAAVSKNGKVTGKKKGTAKITVKMKSGCMAMCTVAVK